MKNSLSRMAEATRLTQAGRLVEAMAVLRGEATVEATATAASTAAGDADIVDLQPPQHPGDAWSVADSAAPKARPSPSSKAPKSPTKRTPKPRVSIDSLAQRLRQPKPTVAIADGARFEARRHDGSNGARDYKIYVPSSYRGDALPLLVMLHGCTQSADDFAVGTRMNDVAEEQGVLVVYPEQSSAANPSRCWNWFDAANQRSDGGESAIIATIVGEVMSEFAVDATRVYAAGLSAGGAAAATLAATYPDLFAAVGVHSGLAHGAATDMPSAFAAMRQGAAGQVASAAATRTVPMIVFHGDADSTVHASNGDAVIAQGGAGRSLQVSDIDAQSDAGIRYRRSEYRDKSGRVQLEHWLLHDFGHAWSGGDGAGSHTDARGPDASREMLRFFLQQQRG